MWDSYEDLEELCETVSKEIKEANEKVRNAQGNLSAGDVEYLDKLTHMLKSIKTTMAMMDSDYSSRGSYNDGGSYRQRSSYRDSSYARGRGANARRDSRGRYSSRMSYDDGMMEELRELMEDAPDERTKQEFQRFIKKIEQM